MSFRIVKNSIAFTALAGVLLLNACRDPEKSPGYEYMPDMYRGPAVETYSASLNNPELTSARKPVAGTIPRGFTYFNYPNTPEGYELASTEVRNPLIQDSLNLFEGKRLFEIYCINCHGEHGEADGNEKLPKPPSYSKGNSSRGGAMKDLTDGKIYHTITYGLNMMGSHASQLLPHERWKIVMYVHQLQHYGDGAASTAKDSTSSATNAGTVASKKTKM